MAKVSNKIKTRLKLVGATFTTIFTLATVFTATIAWFASRGEVTATNMAVRIATQEADIYSVKLIKFDFGYSSVGGERIYDYLTPETGDVNTYVYDKTYNNNQGGYIRSYNQGYIEADIMNRYDPVDSIIHGDSLREMNCNSIYEVTISSTNFTSCYMHLDAMLESHVPGRNEICLSDCVNFEVFYPSDLANDNILFYDIDNDNYHAYYPSYSFDDETDDHLYYKISYLSDLRNSNLTAEDLVDMGILEASALEGKTDEQKAELARATLGPIHKSFYTSNPKDTTNVVRNQQVTFDGTPKTVTVYININYAPTQLEQYMSAIYRNSYTAIEDLYFVFNFTESETE